MSYRRYLLWFANEHVNFKICELESICATFSIPVIWVEKSLHKPFIIVDLPPEYAIKQLAARSLLVRSAFELWSHGHSQKEFFKNLRQLPNDFLSPYTRTDYSFRIRVDTFCKSLTKEQKLCKIEELSFLPLHGSIKLVDPTYSFHLLEYYGNDPNNIPKEPYDIFFGKWICDGKRDAIHKFSLKKRKFIGNTSMDAQLSLIMANQAKVKKGSLVLDPFVGTGSLLVAAAYFGAYIFGSDIDYLTIHGKAKPTRFKQEKRAPDESILTNLHQYGLEGRYMDIVLADAARPLWRLLSIFDAIITDPPYGIRESMEKIGSHKIYKIKEEHIQGHIPSKIHYSLGDLFKDLLSLAANLLKIHGRLVYWYPVFDEDYSVVETFPSHPCLRLVSSSGQSLTKRSSRYLITMEKIKEPTNNNLTRDQDISIDVQQLQNDSLCTAKNS